MPNGIDKNLVRLSNAVAGFRSRFGRWPERVVLHTLSLNDIRRLVSTELMSDMEEKIRFVPGDAAFRTEDSEGHWFEYGSGRDSVGTPHGEPDFDLFVRAQRWLGLDRWHGPPHPPSDPRGHF